jgi:hypothetical protein
MTSQKGRNWSSRHKRSEKKHDNRDEEDEGNQKEQTTQGVGSKASS